MPLFLSFEGPDGSGKSTQARLLAAALRARSLRVIEMREPGSTPLGETVRDLLLDPSSPPASAWAVAMLLSAARVQLVEEIIVPALADGRTVITDRFADSTLAYQGFGFGLDLDKLRQLTALATKNLYPDPVIYVDIAPEHGMERVRTRGPRNRLDAETLAFHQRVRDGYHWLAGTEPGRWICVNGDQAPEQVHREIMDALEHRLGGDALA